MNVTRFRIFHSLFLLIVFTFLVSVSAFAQFDGGNGTESDPWQVATVEQLQSLASYPDAHFILTSDIDASSTAGWNDGLGFEPIGNSNSRFTGTLNGNGYIISDITINRGEEDHAGLFGITQYASLRHVQLVAADISARNGVGGLVGLMVGGIIEQSSVTGSISGEEMVGGLTGNLFEGTIVRSYSAASVIGSRSVGGITGDMEASEIDQTYSLSDIDAESNVGGLAGIVRASGFDSDDYRGLMSRSYAAGSVEGIQETGGLIGAVEWIVLTSSGENHDSEIWLNLNSSEDTPPITSYWDSVATGQQFAVGSHYRCESFDVDTVGLETSQMTGQNAYIHMLDFDFNDTWQLTSGYPVLSWQGADDTVEIPEVPRIIAEADAIEFGTSGIGIQKTIDFSIENSGTAKLSVDISVSGPDEPHFMIDPSDQSHTISPNTTISIPVHFTPESSDSVQAELLIEHNASNEETPMVVLLSGEGMSVDFAGGSGTANDPWQIETLNHLNDVRLILQDYYILMNELDASETSQWNNGDGFNPIGDSDTGFSGSFNGNDYEIHGLFINRPDSNGVGMFGFMDRGTIERITLKDVQVTGGRYTGSLVGYKRDGTIIHSHTDGSVKGTSDHTGGFIGYHRGGEVRKSSSSVNVVGIDDTGGLVGFNGAAIADSWSSGSVTGENGVGGLTGGNGYAPPLEGNISRSYATGNVIGQNRVGGLSGTHSNGRIENVFATGDVSGEITVGGLIGYGSEPLVNAYAAGSVEGESKIGGIAGSSGFSSLSSVYWDKDVSGVNDATGSGSSDGMTGATTMEMQQQSTFSDWDFEGTWAITEGETYPYLQQLGMPVSNEIEAQPGEVPRSAELHQNYPNPFNPMTVIEYQLSQSSDVTLEVFDVTGRRVAVFIERKIVSAGSHRVEFDASGLASGVYLYRLKTGQTILTQKMVLMK